MMRRTDGRHGPLDFSSAHALGFTYGCAPGPDAEARHRDSTSGDVEGEIGNWEAAWIDLGGEG
jgi:hypothetical protein